MIKIAVYGKGGIGKSTTVSNVAAALAEQGLKVLQIGCDPKADSTILLRHGEEVPTVLQMYQEKKQNLKLEDIVKIGYKNIVCVEAGGPTPGLGCAGRGIITALEKLEETGAYKKYEPDVVLYDVLGDVVCGGFSMPMRNGYADQIFIGKLSLICSNCKLLISCTKQIDFINIFQSNLLDRTSNISNIFYESFLFQLTQSFPDWSSTYSKFIGQVLLHDPHSRFIFPVQDFHPNFIYNIFSQCTIS